MDISSLTVSEIKVLLEQDGIPAQGLLSAMAVDKRSAVKALYNRYVVLQQKHAVLLQRQREMQRYERGLADSSRGIVAGVDEAGRGPLAGPVVAAAVILPPEVLLEELDDSKRLTPAKRELLDNKIKKVALDWAVGVATVGEIEMLNIHHASMLAMLRAVGGLGIKPGFLLVDGKFELPDTNIAQKAVVGGDGLCPSIAAASVVAKVTRDRLMEILHLLYPEYGFDRHKGYGTAFHLAALSEFGPCPVHRRDFAPVKQLINNLATLLCKKR
ncbi:RNase HII [Desulfotomaculum arcticum]|uniref:Ribonuclease HII n=1 Tax=Desulfotruncus arcticus DSM 17038 TaxID=1121424 RepID=A0A1I2RIJ7_9FIRM|nr:ribonuclease HII [Desulfotruncus arcticus]SFG40240.1 RNase HII [Desulfotomaculum arcticum] [Desulfotruncus arcticus DSM 17038]